MKKLLIGLVFLTSPAHAESLCGVTDRQVVLDALAGDWLTLGSTSIFSGTFDVLDDVHGTAYLDKNGGFSSNEAVTSVARPKVVIDENTVILSDRGQVYDVDQVDDMIETVEAEWIADEVSLTPCGPEGLLQLTGTVSIVNEFDATLTLIPYFTDKVVVISELEAKVDWGIAYVTNVTLLTRD